jgi:hypothetical protein
MLKYYLYTHTRLDTNEVFYVGIGRTPRLTNCFRAHTKGRRSKEWLGIIKACNNNYKVSIVQTFDNHDDCCLAEINLISKYGRKIREEGSLVNKAPGGHKWKDSIKVYQYDLQGNFIAEWVSPKIAESVLGISHNGIYKSCRLLQRTRNYQFRTFKVDNIEPYLDKQKKSIYQYTKLGVFIKAYSSIAEAAQDINVKPERLSNSTKRNRSCKGFLWSFNKDYCLVRRIISQYSSSEKLIAQYISLPEAAKALKVNSINSIDCAIKGKVQKQAYGFIWKSENNVKIFNNAIKIENL